MSEPIVDLLAEEWAALSAFAAELTEEQWKTPTALPGWTVQDCLAHIVGTERSLLGDPAPQHDVSHLPHVRNDFGALMEVWVEEYRPSTGAEVLAVFDEVIPRRLEQLRAMSDDELEQPGWSPIGEVPYRQFMQVRLFDSWMHEQDMRRALGRAGHESGPVVDVALQRFPAALGMIVGKRAGATEGQSVVFHVQGEPERVYPVVVTDGRAKVLDPAAAPTEPTAAITLPFATFVALGGGRWDRSGAEAAGGLSVAGDAALAARVLDSLAFTP